MEKRKKKMYEKTAAFLTAGMAAAMLVSCGIKGGTQEKKDAAVTEETKAATEAAEVSVEESKEAEVKAEYHKISAEEAKNRMESGDDLILLDVRTEQEYENSHIPGAIVIPNESIGKETLKELPDLDQEILVYCRSGNRSAQAAKKMVEAGYTKVYDFGGIIDWPYETESSSE